MVTQPAYLKALKQYARLQFGELNEISVVIADVKAESDRGLVILSATGIEDILEWAITAKMPNLIIDEAFRPQLFGPEKPLGSFSSKIAMAYALGIIDKPTRGRIDLIREMRNACAHARLPLSFARPELMAVAKKVLEPMLPHITSHHPAVIREMFHLECNLIQQNIITGRSLTLFEAMKEADEGVDPDVVLPPL
jgi:DNA-binding MltR family transcriptional regulator